MDALGTKQAIYCPAFPENGRTIFFGHLFVGDILLSDSHMRHHPLNPMTDSSLVRVLARQTRHKVGLVPLRQVQSGSATLRTALDKLALDSVRHVVVDAVADTDLGIIGEAVGDDVLVTGGSGVALGLPAAYRRRGLITHRSGADTLPKIDGPSAVLSGSCSAATLGQIAAFKGAHLVLDTDAICRGEDIAGKALAERAVDILDTNGADEDLALRIHVVEGERIGGPPSHLTDRAGGTYHCGCRA